MLRLLVRLSIVVFWAALIYSIPFLSRLYTSTVADDRSITILTWADVFDQSVIDNFTRQTGIKVHLSHYESNEEMLVKLQATRGKGYDVVIPSDYAVAVLKERNLLQKLDHSKLPALHTFVPLTVGQSFDPLNEYSLPCLWEVFVLGIDKELFPHGAESSWKLLFEPPLGLRVAMASDAREALCFAHQYVYGNPAPILPEQLTVLATLLKEQKKQIEAYVEFRADYLLATHNCAVAVSSSSYILRSMKQFPHIGFIVPREGTFITIENFVIPAASQKTDFAHMFINYMCSSDVAIRNYELFSFFPATQPGLRALNLTVSEQELLKAIQNIPVHFIQLLTTEKQLQEWWVSIKA